MPNSLMMARISRAISVCGWHMLATSRAESFPLTAPMRSISSRIPTEDHRSAGDGITGTSARSVTNSALCVAGDSTAGGQSTTM